MSTQRVLVPLSPGFEEIETVTPVDLLRRAGATVVLAATGETLAVRGRTGMTLQADARLTEVEAESFSLLLLPGGPAVSGLRQNLALRKVAQDFDRTGKWIGAICAAPLILHDAGLLRHRNYTAHFSTGAELPEAQRENRIVCDGNLITSRGAGTALDFGLTLIRQLFGEQVADEVSQAIMA